MKAAELNLPQEWLAHYERMAGGASQPGFVQEMREKVGDPENIAIIWCGACAQPAHQITSTQTEDLGWVCAGCYARYYNPCADCGAFGRNHRHVGDDRRLLCLTCLAERYFHCRHCGTYYPNEVVNAHLHGADLCCVSPQTEFTFPNAGERLASDTRVTIGAENGIISRQGMVDIRALLQEYARALDPRLAMGSRGRRMWDFATHFDVGDQKVTPQGNFATRLKRTAYKEAGLKLEPDLLTLVGNIASRASQGATYHVEVTRNLNLPAHMYGNAGSCWWSDYRESRCALKTNGGLAVRTFASPTAQAVTGRVWVMPLHREVDGRLRPTFRTDGEVWFVFNAYGTLHDQAGVRLVSEMTGVQSYRSVTFNSEGMYVNNSTGYLVAPTQVLNLNGLLNLHIETHSNLYQSETNENQEMLIHV